MNPRTARSFPRVPRRGLACVILLLLAVVPVVAAQQPWISVQGGGLSRISDDTVDQTLSILIGLEGIAAESVRLGRIQVLRDNVTLAREDADAFTVEERVVTVEAAFLARIRIGAGRVTRPGTYEIWISARAEGHPDASPQLLKCSVEHPAAVVTVLEPVRINIVRGRDTIDATPLKLELKGDVARLDKPVLGPMAFPDALAPVSAMIEPKTPLQAFTKGAGLQSEWTLRLAEERPHATGEAPPRRAQGQFPLGRLEGVANLTGDQIKEPLPIKISIRTRRSFVWLVVAVVAGLGFGFIMKTLLANYLELRRACAEGQLLLAEAKRQLLLYPDEILAQALKDNVPSLEAALLLRDKNVIIEKAKLVRVSLPAALETLRKKQQETLDEIDMVRKSIAQSRELPEKMAGVVLTATEGIRAAAALVEVSVAKAVAKLEESKAELVAKLQDEIGPWKDSFSRRLKELQDEKSLLLPLQVGRDVSARATQIAKDLENAVDAGSVTADSAGVQLDHVDRLRRQTRYGLLNPIPEYLGSVVEAVLRQLDSLLSSTPKASVDVRSALQAAQNALVAGTVEGRLREACSVAREQTMADAKTIQALVDARDYLGAAASLRPAERKGAAPRDVLLSARDVVAGSTGVEVAAAPLVEIPPAAPRRVGASPAVPAASFEEVRLSLTRTLTEIAIAEVIQTVAVGILFGLVAYATYAEQYVGTPKELIGIFFWAFGTDLTVAKLLEAGKGLK
jgi:hypothetical protein